MHNIQKTKPKIQSIASNYGLEAAQKAAGALVRTVSFQPMYSISDAAKCLCVTNGYIRKLIASKRLGSFDLGEPGKPKVFITGWQLIDFLEAAQVGKLDKAA